MFKNLVSKLLNLFSKKEIEHKAKTRNDLEAMSKKELEVYARTLGIGLDRRKKQTSLVNEVLRAQIKNNE